MRTKRISILGLSAAMATMVSASPAAAETPREAIQNAVNCVTQGNDAVGSGRMERGVELFSACYAEDGIMEVYFPGATDSPGMTAQSPTQIALTVSQVLPSEVFAATQHLTGSTVFHSVSEDSAEVISYVVGINWMRTGGAQLGTATYEDFVVRTDDGWKVARRKVFVTGLGAVEAKPVDGA